MMITQMRHCRCCGAEVKHNGWLDVCDDPECVRKGTRDHARKKHLTVFRAGRACHGVVVCDFASLDGRCLSMRAVYFDTEAQAKEFAARARAGMPEDELATLIEAHKSPSERITIEELRRRAKTDE